MLFPKPVDPISAGVFVLVTLLSWPFDGDCEASASVDSGASAAAVAIATPGANPVTDASGEPKTAGMTDADREAVANKVLAALEKEYVFPEVAAKMTAEVRTRIASGAYKGLHPDAFANLLTRDLQSVSKDKHLRVRWSERPDVVRELEGGPADPDPASESKQREQRRAMSAKRNFGFERVERLSGNIGYLDLRGFNHPEVAAPTANAAMAFLGNTDALIVDLRHNGGGTPEMVAHLSSFLFGKERVHLNDLYFRPNDTTEEYWTHEVPGPSFEGKDVYVLTSSRTFSAAEEFTYNLKCLKRATIVGEVTGGGANPGGMQRIDEHFAVFVPRGRAINPITKTNWEGTGVEPDVAVKADQALDTARMIAIDKAIDAETDEEMRGALIGERDRIAGQLGLGSTR
jgi:retinol-binding protein 3